MHKPAHPLPPLEWIRAFEAAARCGSFTAAAAETGLTQSAISQRIGHLEHRLAVRLFHRNGRKIALTVEGEAWLPHVTAAFRSLGDSTETLFGRNRHTVTISASQSVIQLWLLPRLGRLTGDAAMQIQLQTMVTGAHEAPLDGTVQIRYGTGDWAHPYRRPLYAESLAPLAAPSLVHDQRDTSTDWTTWPRIACTGARPGWTAWAARFGGPTTPAPALRVDTFAAAHDAAIVGIGVVLGSLPLCKEALDAGRLVRLDERALDHHESYWMLGSAASVAPRSWQALERLIG